MSFDQKPKTKIWQKSFDQKTENKLVNRVWYRNIINNT
jgi:hypothetical protein